MLGGSGWGHADTMFIRGHMSFVHQHAVLDAVKSGYVLPFYSLPTPYTRPNQCTALLRLMMLTMQWVSF